MRKKRSNMKIIASLISLLGKLAYLIILAVFGGFLGNISAIAVMTFGSIGVGKLIDPSFVSLSLETIIILTIVSGLLRGLLRFFEQYNNHYIAFTLLASLRDKIFGALSKLAPAKLEGKKKGSIIAMLTSDIETLEVFYAHTISPVLIAVLVDGLIFALVSAISNIYMGLIALSSYILIGAIAPIISFRALKKSGQEYRKEFSETSSYFLDSIKGIDELTMHNGQNERKKIINSQSSKMNSKIVSIKRKSSVVDSITGLIVSMVVLLSTFVGVLFVIDGQLDTPNLVVALVMLFSSFGPVLALSSLPSNLTQTFASGERILELFDESPSVKENAEGEEFAFDNASLRNVSFAYGDDDVLDNINIDINKNEIAALVGPSGSGKSTILKLLDRFYDVKDGEVLYNGIPIKDIKTKSLRDNVVLVSQSTYLFNDTILNNINFVNKSVSMDEIIEACKKASIHDFIASLPQGYDTEVGLLGESLSAGEKQRIGLARAFLSKAPLVLLDEVTSNVDAINEGIMLKSIKDNKDKTFVIVSHRESTIAIADKVYRMNKGAI